MERFQASLARNGKLLLDSLSGSFTSADRSAGIFAAPAGSALVAKSTYDLVLADGDSIPILISRVTPNAHRPMMIEFTSSPSTP
jgi:hypothetical protein